MNRIITQKRLSIFFYVIFSITLLLCNSDTNSRCSSQIRTIHSILEAKNLLDQASPKTLVVFDIGETLVIQKNNLLRIIRNHRIFNSNDINVMNCIITKFMRQDPNARSTILSNMLINSPLHLVESEIKTIIKSLQERQVKVIAHCSSKDKVFGAIKNFKEWRFSVLKKLGIDLSSSFGQNELALVALKDDQGFSPTFYKGILFGGSPKGKALLALLDELKFIPSEVIYFDDCELFAKSYAKKLKKRNINFKGFIYQAALRPTPKLNSKIVDVQVKYMKQKRYIDDLKAERIIRRSKK